MTRFRSASDPQVPYSDLHPERFEGAEAYQSPRDGVVRAVDDVPEERPARSERANVGFSHLKGAR